VNEDQVKKLKRHTPKQPPSAPWIKLATKRGLTQKQMAIKWGISARRMRARILELGLARSPVEAGKLRHKKNRPQVKKAKRVRRPVIRTLRYRSEHSKVFYDTLCWVDSLNEMPTEEEMKKHVIPGLMSEWLIKSMIETRLYRKLKPLKIGGEHVTSPNTTT